MITGASTPHALRRQASRLLVFLILVDALLCLIGFAWPELWFHLIHGAPAVDPQRLLQRTAAAWAAFLALQIVAHARFRREPVWLAVIAGVRLGDMFTDWTHVIVAADMTWLGYLCLLAASPINLLAGLFLLGAHRRLSPHDDSVEAPVAHGAPSELEEPRPHAPERDA